MLDCGCDITVENIKDPGKPRLIQRGSDPILYSIFPFPLPQGTTPFPNGTTYEYCLKVARSNSKGDVIFPWYAAGIIEKGTTLSQIEEKVANFLFPKT
jgi:hypothetical protein